MEICFSAEWINQPHITTHSFRHFKLTHKYLLSREWLWASSWCCVGVDFDANSRWLEGIVILYLAIKQSYLKLTHRAIPCVSPSLSHPYLTELPHSEIACTVLPPRWLVGALFSLILGSLPSHLQVAWIISNYSAHLFLYPACQVVGRKFSFVAHLSAYKRNRDHTLHSCHLPCVTHRLTNLRAQITVPVFQVRELTKANLSQTPVWSREGESWHAVAHGNCTPSYFFLHS